MWEYRQHKLRLIKEKGAAARAERHGTYKAEAQWQAQVKREKHQQELASQRETSAAERRDRKNFAALWKTKQGGENLIRHPPDQAALKIQEEQVLQGNSSLKKRGISRTKNEKEPGSYRLNLVNLTMQRSKQCQSIRIL
jgi:hypothetical protein